MFKWLLHILIFATNIRVTPITKIQNFLHLSKIVYFYQNISVFRPSGHIFPQVRSSYHGIFYTGIFIDE